MIQCEKGHENPDGAMYCKECGIKINSVKKTEMIDRLSKQQLRELLDEIGYRTASTSSGDYYLKLEADTEFNYTVVVVFELDEKLSRLQIWAQALEFEFTDMHKPIFMVKCNRWNNENFLGKAILTNENKIRFEYAFLLDEPTSKAYVVENVIKLTVTLAWRFFVEFSKY